MNWFSLQYRCTKRKNFPTVFLSLKKVSPYFFRNVVKLWEIVSKAHQENSFHFNEFDSLQFKIFRMLLWFLKKILEFHQNFFWWFLQNLHQKFLQYFPRNYSIDSSKDFPGNPFYVSWRIFFFDNFFFKSPSDFWNF